MLIKPITYTDFDGETRTEKFHFNLSRTECLEFEAEAGSIGLKKLLEKMVKEEDTKRLFAWFKKIVLTAYGEKSIDGKRFVKSEELSKAFEQSNAYDVLMVELFTGGEKAVADFINAVIPSADGAQGAPVAIPSV